MLQYSMRLLAVVTALSMKMIMVMKTKATEAATPISTINIKRRPDNLAASLKSK